MVRDRLNRLLLLICVLLFEIVCHNLELIPFLNMLFWMTSPKTRFS